MNVYTYARKLYERQMQGIAAAHLRFFHGQGCM